MAISESLKKAQERYTNRNINEGLVRVNLWIPKENAEEIKEIAQEMRDEKRGVSE